MSRSRNSGKEGVPKDDDQQPSSSGLRRSSDSGNQPPPEQSSYLEKNTSGGKNLSSGNNAGEKQSSKNISCGTDRQELRSDESALLKDNLENSNDVNYDNFSSAIQTATRYDKGDDNKIILTKLGKTSEEHQYGEQIVDPTFEEESLPRYYLVDEENDNVASGIFDDRVREFYIPPTPSTDEKVIFTSGVTVGKNFAKFDSIPIQASGENVPRPIADFSDAGLNQAVYNNIVRSKYTKPTPIQKTTIPVVASGRDLIACAQTGSGKTASYLIPLVDSLLGAKVNIGKPNVVILTPTRELAIQIYNETLKFAYNCDFEARVLYGGTSTKYQQNLVLRANILICTVGRLIDFVRREYISFECTTTFVLDEADRLLDQGFYDEILFLIKHKTILNPENVQILMYSATFPTAVQMLAANLLKDYVFISVGIVGSACSDIKQTFFKVAKFEKRYKLMDMLMETEDISGTLIFVETKRLADFLATFLSEHNIPSTSIHGGRLQSQRELALKDFKTGHMKILVATNVAARGLDIKNIKHVINFDLPFTIEEYVHRIGRTGRLGNNGKATSFYDPNVNRILVNSLVKILLESGQKVPDFFKERNLVNLPVTTGQRVDNRQFGAEDIRVMQPVQIIRVEAEESWDSSI
ncbi:ATP-dependent RNA helicase vasa-like isoform X2 [Teleopsis dalmanni]|uniref:ATP-dependent RNA helicase vasa-like isoform X2 n=1 Tax=Teleopsis dalmanni TaxID=139649 RepID=UPI0018CEF7A8|nr:ATP-dependent RNA helicase vasa-like isoform X2 [Teleopsis dalmanni]